MKNTQIIFFGKSTFWLSFIAGNICLFGYLVSRNMEYAVAGYFLLFIAGLINILIVIGLLIYGFIRKEEMPFCLKSVAIILLNIPIAALYAWIGTELI